MALALDGAGAFRMQSEVAMTCPKLPDPLSCAALGFSRQTGADLMAARSPGRPKDAEKLGAILDAAMTLFAERGLDGAPIEAIAAAAGVSKVTIYANFKCKSDMLEAIVARHTDHLGDIGEEIAGSEGTLAERLTRFGHALVAMISEPNHRALDCSLALEAQRNPELARKFFEAGPGHLRRLLANMLQDAVTAGEIKLDCTQTASEDLLGLWLGFASIEKRYQLGSAEPDRLLARIDHGVDLFLRAHRPAA